MGLGVSSSVSRPFGLEGSASGSGLKGAWEQAMAIGRIDRTVVSREFLVGAVPDRVAIQGHLPARLGLAVAVARPVLMVVLASLAILVLLPAALAAQAAAGI